MVFGFKRVFMLVMLFGVAVVQAGQTATDTPEKTGQEGGKVSKFNSNEALVPPYVLPDLFPKNARPIRTPAEWRPRRAEILALFSDNVYGRSPGRPEQMRFEVAESDARALNGTATWKRIVIHSKQGARRHQMQVSLFLPNQVKGAVPVFMLLNHRSASITAEALGPTPPEWTPVTAAISRGYGVAEVMTAPLAPDNGERYREGVIELFDGSFSFLRSSTAWGAIGAWAWGASRAVDYLVTDPRVDAKRIAVLGHSRGGKASLWAGAQDERFALVIANDAGEGGASLNRRRFGETIAVLTEHFPHWFAERYEDFSDREEKLPVDQHMLMATIAPRAVYIASASEDWWADPRGEFLALAASSPVYALWNEPSIGADDMPPPNEPLVVGRRGYHLRAGPHDMKAYDWLRFMDFADGLWKR